MTPEHLQELAEAKRLLENPGFAIKAGNLLGRPIEKGFELLPKSWNTQVGVLTQDALKAAVRTAIATLDKDPAPAGHRAAHTGWHKAAATLSGAAGGFFGLAALPVELPVSTAIICRSIADIARAQGENLREVDTQLACIQVFALGGRSHADDASETAYFSTRAAMAKAVSDAAQYLASQKLAQDSAPALLRLIALVAARFQIQITEKAAAQAVPIIGAGAGALLNLLFIDHFQDMSRGHFTIRRLERLYGTGEVQARYALPAPGLRLAP